MGEGIIARSYVITRRNFNIRPTSLRRIVQQTDGADPSPQRGANSFTRE